MGKERKETNRDNTNYRTQVTDLRQRGGGQPTTGETK